MHICNRPALIINAGGESRRMGQSKARLPTPPDGRPLLQHVLQRLAPLQSARIIVVTNDETLPQVVQSSLTVEFVADAYPHTGALGGIATGLRRCDGWAWTVACDMPFVKPEALGLLYDVALASPQRCDAVVPYVHERWQTLHALYHVRCLRAIERRLVQGRRKVIGFFPDIQLCPVAEQRLASIDPQLDSFFNANTPVEWATALERLAQTR